ncbi:protein ECERIFERUM 26-like [Gastrolobium bilobum]|uniref:protein ECERIFERUM 26-like n=1 Tax=Gastrolobium bilobum TaxID=150636 RepID=UPI002AB28841|nr:protein ECERIFERUM 26-like [Gastrolobium bilobum]
MGSLGNSETTTLSSRISTVVPATPRGEEKGEYQLNYMDLLMKLHYIRPVYFFNSEAVQGLSIFDLKKPMFPLLDPYSHVSGRIRRSESGRPFIKCNDAGVRIAESHCDKTLREWFDENGDSVDGLVHDHVLGPDLSFSPLVFIKFTWFKCGGLSVGLSWAHVVGDAFSAFNFITKWSQTLAGHAPPKSLHKPNLCEPQFPPNSVSVNPVSVKKARIVGEYWLAANDSDVATHSFHVTSKQLHHLVTETKTSYFEILSALVWKCISHIREDFGPKVVTICTSSSNRAENEFPTNGLVLSKVEADLTAGESDISELAKLIAEKKMVENENHVMEKLAEEDEGKGDFIVYGSNLTFVDLEAADFYGVKLNGKKPIMANCTFRGVGDQGVVLVLPAPRDNEDGGNGRIITVSLPEKELDQLKDKLDGEWGIHCLHP